jgi:hypothetical protein
MRGRRCCTRSCARNRPRPLPLTVVLALPRPKMLRRILRALAEVGVKELHLINSYRVEKSYWQSPLLAPTALRLPARPASNRPATHACHRSRCTAVSAPSPRTCCRHFRAAGMLLLAAPAAAHPYPPRPVRRRCWSSARRGDSSPSKRAPHRRRLSARDARRAGPARGDRAALRPRPPPRCQRGLGGRHRFLDTDQGGVGSASRTLELWQPINPDKRTINT